MNKKEFKILKEKLFDLSKNVVEIKSKIITEEATKQSLILPFFQILKYDVFNPSEFTPEYNADFGIKKGEKVDYAIILEEKLSILVEAKSCNIKLDKHGSQLSRYFNTVEQCIGILTNGIEYRFFADLEVKNRMDEEPFCTINLLDLKEENFEFLYDLMKHEFSMPKIKDKAEELKDKIKIKDVITKELLNPSDEMVGVIMSSINNKRKTISFISKYKPIIKESINEKVKELAIECITNELEEPLIGKTNKIVTTEEELVAYGLILGILGEYIDLSNICYKDTENYFNILLLSNVRKWICRLYLNGTKKYIIFPDGDKIFINDISEICNLKLKLLDALKLRVNEINETNV